MLRKALVLVLSAAAIVLVVLSMLEDYHEPGSPGTPVAEPVGDIHVEVLNGCGTNGVAKEVGRYLRSRGFDVLTIGNAPTFNYPETIVIDRVGNRKMVDLVGDALGVQNRIQQIIPDPFRIEQVTVIVGRDHTRLDFTSGS